ncbi:MAG TPA: hypothetical protein VE077_02750 [Candidatus Methylomirabilis sp.]|nr:hypothetical protein [Candidatus Methylomirabilis sp.]
MERPTGVTIIAVLYFLGAACLVLVGLLSFVGGSLLSGMARSGGPGSAIFAMGGAVIGVVCLLFAVLEFAIGFGLIKLQNWARVTAIVLTAIGILFGLLGLLNVAMHLAIFSLLFQLIILAIYVWILVYLLKPHVKQAFGAASI